MKRNISILTVILLVVPLLSGFARKAEKYTDPTLPIEQRVDDLLKRMTLDEKIAQMDMVGVWSFDEFKESEMIRTTGVGAFIGEVTPERYNEVQALSEKSRLKIPMLVGVDAVHGYGVLQNRTIFPTSISMAATFNPELVNRAARIAAREIRSAGNQWTFAPTLDIVQDARFGRTGETYGECPFLTTAMARSAIRGYQNHENPQHRVAACVKHYVGGGASIGGVNHGNAEISERMLRSVFLPPFKAAVEEGVLTVMPGHNNINGIPMHASEWLLTDILKEEFGFDGFVITDMGDIENLREDRIHGVASDQKDAVRQAIAAGVDMHMFTTDNTENGQRMFQGNLRELVHEGKISTATIDRAVRRILTVKFELGLFETAMWRFRRQRIPATAATRRTVWRWKLRDRASYCSRMKADCCRSTGRNTAGFSSRDPMPRISRCWATGPRSRKTKITITRCCAESANAWATSAKSFTATAAA